jgi:hypothetical protein
MGDRTGRDGDRNYREQGLLRNAEKLGRGDAGFNAGKGQENERTLKPAVRFDRTAMLQVKLDDSPALDDANEHDHDREHQENVDETRDRVSGDQPKRPHQEQNHGNGEKHSV